MSKGITFTEIERDSASGQNWVLYSAVWGSYTTGGDSADLSGDFTKIIGIGGIMQAYSTGVKRVVCEFTSNGPTAGLKWNIFTATAGVEASGDSDQSAVDFRVMVFGR